MGRLNQKYENCTHAVTFVGHLPIQSREGKVRKVPHNGGGSPTCAILQPQRNWKLLRSSERLGRSNKDVMIMSKTVKLSSAHRGNLS